VALSRKVRISQTAVAWRRVCGVISSGARQPRVDPGGHGRQHPREAELVRRYEGRVGGDQGDRDLSGRVVEPPPDLPDDERHREPDRDPAGGRAQELEPRVERRERPAHCGSHRHPVGDERGGVVHEALALDEVHEPARGAELPHDRRGGHGIGRRDDRPKREGERPRHPDHLVRDHRDRPHRQQHQADRCDRDRPQVAAQRA
jgi:hypothetical protein